MNGERFSNNEDNVFKVCEEALGCIETDSRWYHKKFRPINLRPLPRHILKTDFLLIKKHNSNVDELFYTNLLPRESSIRESEFRNDSELMILIHDFTANGYTGWIKHLAKTIFIHSIDTNLISVDWQRGAEPPYDQAVANARVVALETISLIKELQDKFNYSLNNIHIVGHGIGAHIAGYIGTTYNKMKKITGLDPSGPRFQGMPNLVKLSAKNAKYVEVIHTDYYESRSLGINETLGHSDFFVNGARRQPGCPENNSFDNVLSVERTSLRPGDILPSCSHKRAFKYFVEALVNKNCKFQGIKCGSLSDFENGKCTRCNDHDCREFGLKTYADTSEGNQFFLNTAGRYPYCLLEYRIGVYITDDEKHGNFHFILVDENSNVAEAVVSTEEESYRLFKSGVENNNTFVYFASPPRLKNIKEAKYDFSEDIFFCPREDRVQIESGSYVTFRRCTEKTEPYNTPLGSVKDTLTHSEDENKSTETFSESPITSKVTTEITKSSSIKSVKRNQSQKGPN
ncbi:pancreatic triacylglycerol lipase-like [Diorhabda sublineata]|uniref:pancreatic triacylglycerol lipase-like n=1 Tax=Diorhabda sublineata TaxID=1163346 RepID=UPI0024E1827E|nr:pancreatic triacylglycerol lipase-like [Diorhabda sublineata]